MVFEKTARGWSDHAPGLPGLGIAGLFPEETEIATRDGIDLQWDGMRGEGLPIPEPKVRVATPLVAA